MLLNPLSLGAEEQTKSFTTSSQPKRRYQVSASEMIEERLVHVIQLSMIHRWQTVFVNYVVKFLTNTLYLRLKKEQN